MNHPTIRQRLRRGDCVYGTQVLSLMNPVAAAMTADLPLDFVFICTEHMPIDRTEVSMMCQFYAAHGISPIVRVPSADEISASAIGMALDGGAQGIVVPYVETAQQVMRAVGATRYRPLKGKRLTEAMDGTRPLCAQTKQFLNTFNADRYLIIGIESLTAIEHLEELITIPGVDGVFLGPHDISVSMGIPTEYTNPRFIEQIEQLIRRCRVHHVGVGVHTPLFRLDDAVLRRLMDAGLNWLINGSDVTIMRDAMSAQLRRLRELTGDEPTNDTEHVATSDDEHRMSALRTCIG